MKNDYTDSGRVTLNRKIFDVMIITEKNQLVLNNSDIMELYFIEDIFKFCLTGTMTFNDRYNVIEYGPFTGNEKIAIIYSVGDDRERELVFDIWKVGRIQGIGTGMREGGENLITMHFVDPFYTGFSLRKYSRSWSNEYYSNIMKDILNNMVYFKATSSKFNIEQSSNKTDFIMPYWTPQTSLRWLMRRAKGKQSGTSGYLCYNNTKDNFSHNLYTMNYLLQDQGKTLDPVKYVFQDKDVSGENKILEWWISGIDRQSLSSIRGGRWRGNDFSTKKMLDFEQVYSEGADATTCLGRTTLYSQIDDLHSTSLMVGENSNENLETVAYNDWAKRYNMQFIMNIIVQGNEKRYAGQHIEIVWPSARKNVGSDPSNSLLKGRYLIKSITHSFSPGGTYPYRQRLVLIKNAYNAIDSKVLYQAKKPNVFSDAKTNVQFIRK
jgi:hypothetical protein